MITINESFDSSLPLWVRNTFVKQVKSGHTPNLKLDQLIWEPVEVQDLPFTEPLKSLGDNIYMLRYKNGNVEVYDSDFNGPDDVTFEEILNMKFSLTGNTLDDIIDCGYISATDLEVPEKDRYVSDRDTSNKAKGKYADKDVRVYWDDTNDTPRDRSGYKYDNRKYVTKRYKELLDNGNFEELMNSLMRYYKSSISLVQNQIQFMSDNDYDDGTGAGDLSKMTSAMNRASDYINLVKDKLRSHEIDASPILPYVRSCIKLINNLYKEGFLETDNSTPAKESYYVIRKLLGNRRNRLDVFEEYVYNSNADDKTKNKLKDEINKLAGLSVVSENKLYALTSRIVEYGDTYGIGSGNEAKFGTTWLKWAKEIDKQPCYLDDDEKDDIMNYIYQLCSQLDKMREYSRQHR